jgi:hypothetical protein
MSITITDIVQTAPGTKENPVWLGKDFEATVGQIVAKQTSTGKEFYITTLSDPHNPSVSIEATFFTGGIASKSGKVCHFSGQGMKLEEYKGKPKIAVGDKAKINVVGAAPSAGAAPAQRSPAAPAAHAPAGQAGILGVTVGMAIVQAISILRESHPGETLDSYYTTTAFSRDLHIVASDIIRIGQLLERGQLAHSAKDRANPAALVARAEAEKAAAQAAAAKAAQDAAVAARKIKPAPDGHSVDTTGADEDVPF